MMEARRVKRLTAALAFAVCSGTGITAAASDCHFAYQFCMPTYYACLAGGGGALECHAMLDQCILNNGCNTLP